MNEKDEKTAGAKAVATAGKAGSDSRVIVIEIGKKQRKKTIKRLRKGRGKLMPKIEAAVKEVQEETGATGVLPIVFVVEKKQRSGRLFW